LKVWLGDYDITAYVAKLESLRLCKDGTVNIRSGSGPEYDEAKLATAADRALLNATIGCLDLKAMAIMDKKFAEDFYNTCCVAKMTTVTVVKTAKPEAAHE
jgi:hypothetical protein